MERRVILASGSPRRKELLKRILDKFEVLTSDCDESVSAEWSFDETVLNLSGSKALAVSKRILMQDNNTSAVVIGADTAVGRKRKSGEGYDILGKPHSREGAKEMLESLSGCSHVVCTGVSVYLVLNGSISAYDSFVSRTEVLFHEMSGREIQEYISTGEPMDKAGAYGIQGTAAKYIDSINGDYYNVVGLPVARLYRCLRPLLYDNEAGV